MTSFYFLHPSLFLLVQAFADEDWGKVLGGRVCMLHLFTSRSFADNILGLAYLAGPESDQPGGMCEWTSMSMAPPLSFLSFTP